MNGDRQTLSYEDIKHLAKELRAKGESVQVGDLLALSRNNDPFYVGSPAVIEKAEWFAEIWRRGQFRSGAHLRRIHYWLVSQKQPAKADGMPYENTLNDWQYLCVAGKAARYLGLVAIEDIADHRNPEPHLIADYTGGTPYYSVDGFDLDDPEVTVNGGASKAGIQPYHLEIWCEKSTMNDVLLPLCERYGANLVTGEGEMSIAAVHKLSRRLREAQKPGRIFYISDFDPAGQSMPKAAARKLEWMLGEAGIEQDVRLTPLALTADQQQEYKLPRTPIKASEMRKKSFEDVHGSGAVELDALEALHPGELHRIVNEALSTYYSVEAEDRRGRALWAMRKELEAKAQAVMDRYRPQLEALREMNAELDSITVDPDDYQIMRADPTADDKLLPWLLDSRRDYMEQIKIYRAFENGRLKEDN